MPVGKGSLNRAAKANEAAIEKIPEVKAPAEKKPAAKKPEVKKSAVKKPAVKKPAAKKPVVAAASVITGSDDIHEKKFEAISKITCDIPTYLL